MYPSEFVYNHTHCEYVRDAYCALQRCFPEELKKIDSQRLSFDEIEQQLLKKYDQLQDECFY